MRPQTYPSSPFVLPEENSSSPRPPFTSFVMPSPLAALYPSSSAPLPHASPARKILFRRYCSYPRLPRNFPMRPQAHSFPLASFSKKLPSSQPLHPHPRPLFPLAFPKGIPSFLAVLYLLSCTPSPHSPAGGSSFAATAHTSASSTTSRCDRKPPFSPLSSSRRKSSSSPKASSFLPHTLFPAPLLSHFPTRGSCCFPFSAPRTSPGSPTPLHHAFLARGILFHRYCSILRLLYNFPMRPQTHPFPLASFSKRKIAILPGPLSLLVPSFPWLFPKEYPLSRCPLPPSSAPLPHASPARGILFRRYCSYPRHPHNFPMRPYTSPLPPSPSPKATFSSLLLSPQAFPPFS